MFFFSFRLVIRNAKTFDIWPVRDGNEHDPRNHGRTQREGAESAGEGRGKRGRGGQSFCSIHVADNFNINLKNASWFASFGNKRDNMKEMKEMKTKMKEMKEMKNRKKLKRERVGNGFAIYEK